MTTKETQNRRLLAELRARGNEGVSAISACIYLRIYRCGARVYDLRKQGHNITTERRVGMTAVYRLVEK